MPFNPDGKCCVSHYVSHLLPFAPRWCATADGRRRQIDLSISISPNLNDLSYYYYLCVEGGINVSVWRMATRILAGVCVCVHAPPLCVAIEYYTSSCVCVCTCVWPPIQSDGLHCFSFGIFIHWLIQMDVTAAVRPTQPTINVWSNKIAVRVDSSNVFV